MFDPVVFLLMRGNHTLAAAPLPPVGGHRQPLDVPGVGHGDDHVLFGDQIFDREFALIGDDLGAALVAKARCQLGQLFLQDLHAPRLGGEDLLALLMNLRTSFSSSSSFVISRAVSRAKRMLRISVDCFSDSLKRFRSAASALGVSFDFLMILITSSMLSTAIFKPSRMCSRSCARCSSNSVRRVMTVWRCSMKCCRSSTSVHSPGGPATTASLIAPKGCCICGWL